MCPEEYYFHRDSQNTRNEYKEGDRDRDRDREREPYYSRHAKEKREAVAVQKYNRKNSTSISTKNKSPLEEIGAVCIYELVIPIA